MTYDRRSAVKQVLAASNRVGGMSPERVAFNRLYAQITELSPILSSTGNLVTGLENLTKLLGAKLAQLYKFKDGLFDRYNDASGFEHDREMAEIRKKK